MYGWSEPFLSFSIPSCIALIKYGVLRIDVVWDCVNCEFVQVILPSVKIYLLTVLFDRLDNQ
jgi:hypothetical protein